MLQSRLGQPNCNLEKPAWGGLCHRFCIVWLFSELPKRADRQGGDRRGNFPSMTPEQWIELSLSYYQYHRYLESIAAAQTAVYLRPS